MIYDESLDKNQNATTVDIYCMVTAYDAMYDWCIESPSEHKFASIITCTTEDYHHFDQNNGGTGTFYFNNANDALLFRLRWGHEIR